MTPERFARYDRALANVGCDLYVSASSADVHHLTGSEDGDAFVVYQPGARPIIVVRASGFLCTKACAISDDVIAFSLAEGPANALVESIQHARPQRVALGPMNPDIAQELTARLSGIQMESTSRLGRDVRRVKELEEIRSLEAAAACVGAGIEACFQAVQVGASDRDAAAAACAAARRYGAETIVFVQVKAGPRSAFPDAEANGRLFEPNEIGFIDLGVRHRSYFGDYARPFVIGQPTGEALRILETVDKIQRSALAMLRPGLRCRDFYLTVRQMCADAGYPDAIPHHLGHGVGIGDDVVPHITPLSEDEFIEGEVVCVEPGVYIPGVGGTRIEDTVVVHSAGNRILSHAPRIGQSGGLI